jgi:hypothetical protein
MKAILYLLILGISGQIFAQDTYLEKLLRITSSDYPDTVYIDSPCPPKGKVKSKPRNIPAPAPVCPDTIPEIQSRALTMDTAVNKTTTIKIYNNNSIVQKNPMVDYNLLKASDQHNNRIRKGNGWLYGAAGLYAGSATAFIIGASRSYNFNVITNSNILQYKNHSIVNTTTVNNIGDILRQQEQERKAWYIAGGGLAIMGTVCIIIGIHEHNKNKLYVTPAGVGYVRTF